MKILLTGCLIFSMMGTSAAFGSEENPVVVIKTSMGDITVELNKEKAPVTVKNFLRYVDEDFYDGTIFHRVIPGFMIQGGGFEIDESGEFVQKKTHDPIKNEAGNGLTNDRGTIAMARTSVVDSATAQFFINVVDNVFLNHKNDTPRDYGYAVFGKVIDGMDVVDKIKSVKTGRKGPFPKDVPLETVLIKSISRKTAEAEQKAGDKEKKIKETKTE